MLEDFNWFTRFFTYSSIQVKFIASFIAAILLIVVRKIFIKILYRNTSNALVRYRWQKISSYVIYILGLVIIGQIWFKGIESIATYLGTEIGLLLSGKKDRSPFMEISHQTMFFYRNRPWFIPFAARYFRFLDWVS